MKKGFTLVELLVVISIIGLLSAVVIASLNSARLKSRDTLRISQILEIQKALEVYRLAHGTYPVSHGVHNNWVNDCDPGVIFVIPELQADGQFSGVKDLVPCNIHWGYSYGSNGVDYKLVSHTERTGILPQFIDPAPDGGPDRCVVDGTDQEHYGVWTPAAKCWYEGEAMPAP
jgi:prepilin-type N-terminal cleavage/methylation domain-containing protein